MLVQAYPVEKLREILLPRAEWHPHPTIEDRKPWETLPEKIRAAHIARGEAALKFVWPPLTADLFLDFVRTGKQDHYIGFWGGRRSTLCNLVIAECMENRGRFLDDITNGVWTICEESYWGVTPHLNAQKAGPGLPDTAEPTVDLFAAETSALLSWTVYLLGRKLDALSLLIVPRIEREIQYRILTPLMEREDFGWMGFNNPARRVNNWNPWINSNWLTTALLIEKDENRRLALVAKSIRCLDNFIDLYPKDGGCDEGPGYWGRAGASLYDCLELLRSATGGKIDVYGDPLVQEMGRFIYRIHIADRYFVNFADAPALLIPSPALVFGYGRRIGDAAMMGMGAWAAQRQDIGNTGVSDSIGRQIPALFSLEDLLGANPKPPLSRDAWLNVIQVMVARDRERSTDGLFVAAKGGHNAESHNHNDVGNVVVFVDGKPVLVDAGVETYSRKTFSKERYTIWTMQSAYHNLPTVNGVQQAPGKEFAARDVRYTSDSVACEV